MSQAPQVDEHHLFGKSAIFRGTDGVEHPAILLEHRENGMVQGIVFNRQTRGEALSDGMAIATAPLVAARQLDIRDRGDMAMDTQLDPEALTKLPRVAVFYEWRPTLKLGTDVLFRATQGPLANPQLPPNIVGVLPGKVVGIDPKTGLCSVMLFPPVGTIMVAQAVHPTPTDIGQPGTCWIDP